MIIYQSKYQQVWFDEEKQLLRVEYFPENNLYTEPDFKKDHDAINAAMYKHLPQLPDTLYLLLDMRNFSFIVTPALQEWHKQYIYPNLIKANVRAVALIPSKKIFSETSTFDTLRNKPISGFRLRRFKRIKDAENWLLQRRAERK